jgi:hypothetical protein
MPKVPGSISLLAIDHQGLGYLCLETTVKSIREQPGEEKFLEGGAGLLACKEPRYYAV